MPIDFRDLGLVAGNVTSSLEDIVTKMILEFSPGPVCFGSCVATLSGAQGDVSACRRMSTKQTRLAWPQSRGRMTFSASL